MSFYNKSQDTHSPVHAVRFHPGKAVLIDPQHQLQTASDTLHVLRALHGKARTQVRLRSILSHEIKHTHFYKKSLCYNCYSNLLDLEHQKSNIFSKVNSCISFWTFIFIFYLLGFYLCLLETKVSVVSQNKSTHSG